MSLEVAKGIVRLDTHVPAPVDLAFQPHALVVWWCREPPAGCTGGIGFATDGQGEACSAWAAEDAVAPGVLRRLESQTALLFCDDPRASDAPIQGRIQFTDRGFLVQCDRPPNCAWVVHYLALGGSDVRGAAVRSMVLDGTGVSAVESLGFAPRLVLATAAAGPGSGESRPDLSVTFGAAAGPNQQVAAGFVARVERSRTVVRGAQCAGALAVVPAAAASGGLGALVRVVSFDRDGFTVDAVDATSQIPLAALVLGGGRYRAGLDRARSRSTAVGFEPAGTLLFGTGLAAMSRARDIGRLCLGGFSSERGTGCVSWSVRARGAWPLEPRSRSSSESAFEVIDTTSGELHARAIPLNRGRRRFSLAWPVRDRYRRDYGYVAFGSEPHGTTLIGRLRLFGGRSLRE
jgi:hypothetical protein